jgi:hypothetical protein
MTVAAAGSFYLANVCKSNAASDALSTVVSVDPFDLAGSQEKAKAYRDALRQVIVEFTKPEVLWPDAVKGDITVLVDGLYEAMGQAASLALTTTPSGFIESWNAYTDPATAKTTLPASQKVRLKLGLSADSKASCSH